jgi:hypothetical protein
VAQGVGPEFKPQYLRGKKNQLKKKKGSFGLQFWRFQSITDWPCWLGSVAAGCGGGGPLTSWAGGKRWRGGARVSIATPPVTGKLPIKPHLLKVPPPPSSAKVGAKLLLNTWIFERTFQIKVLAIPKQNESDVSRTFLSNPYPWGPVQF